MVSISSASIFIVRSFEPLRHGIVPDRRNNALFFLKPPEQKNIFHIKIFNERAKCNNST
jgi:hypothetical protein